MKIVFKIVSIFLDMLAVIGLAVSFFSQRREKKISKLLLRNGLTVSVAESCTGGLISSRLTDVSGSSGFINQNFVTYANEAKVKYLGVSDITIIENGVVSEEVASEMAMGLINNTDCDIALATTGVAGPTGGSKKKPVGTICIAVADKNSVRTMKYNANRRLSRRVIKYIFARVALKFLYNFLTEKYKED